jgi:hypothetical protein
MFLNSRGIVFHSGMYSALSHKVHENLHKCLMPKEEEEEEENY